VPFSACILSQNKNKEQGAKSKEQREKSKEQRAKRKATAQRSLRTILEVTCAYALL
jgi:hypothetical protein